MLCSGISAVKYERYTIGFLCGYPCVRPSQNRKRVDFESRPTVPRRPSFGDGDGWWSACFVTRIATWTYVIGENGEDRTKFIICIRSSCRWRYVHRYYHVSTILFHSNGRGRVSTTVNLLILAEISRPSKLDGVCNELQNILQNLLQLPKAASDIFHAG
jgi:hypothetical protein